MKAAQQLFRYFGPEASDFLGEQKLWFSAAKDFNDVFEVVPRYDKLLKQWIEQRLQMEYAFSDPSIPIDWNEYKRGMGPIAKQLMLEALETLPQSFQAKFSEHFGIICFSANPKSILMWGHYTRCHQGFMVEFDPNHELFSMKEFGKIEYSHTRPFVDENDYKKILLTKSLEWSYEEEYRLIKPLNEPTLGKRRDGKEEYFIPLPLESVKAVYFGCRASAPVRDELLNALSSANAKHIKPFVMRLDPKEFAVEAMPWEEWKAPPPDATADLEALWKSIGL